MRTEFARFVEGISTCYWRDIFECEAHTHILSVSRYIHVTYPDIGIPVHPEDCNWRDCSNTRSVEACPGSTLSMIHRDKMHRAIGTSKREIDIHAFISLVRE